MQAKSLEQLGMTSCMIEPCSSPQGILRPGTFFYPDSFSIPLLIFVEN